MPTRTTRIALVALIVALPGPWTPLLVLAYVFARTAEPCTAAVHGIPNSSPVPKKGISDAKHQHRQG